MTETNIIKQYTEHIDKRLDDLFNIMGRVGNIGDNNAIELGKLQTRCEYLEKELTDQKKDAETSKLEDTKIHDNLYLSLSKRIKVKTVMWGIGIQTTVMIAAATILMAVFS